MYRNDPKFSDKKVWANSVDPDQAASTRSTLFAIPSASLGHKPHTLQSLYNATRYNTVLVITRPGLGYEMVIFL